MIRVVDGISISHFNDLNSFTSTTAALTEAQPFLKQPGTWATFRDPTGPPDLSVSFHVGGSSVKMWWLFLFRSSYPIWGGSANQTGLGTCRKSEPTTLRLVPMTPPCSAWCHGLKCGHSAENHFQLSSCSFHAKPFAFIWMDWHWFYEVTNSVHICCFLVDSWREFTQTQIVNDLM